MSDENLNLIGELVTIYTVGGFIFNGRVVFVNDEKIIIEDNDKRRGVNKIHIVAFEMSILEDIDNLSSDTDTEEVYPPYDYDINDIAGLSQYGSIIPEDMLLPPETPTIPTGFSMQMGGKFETRSFKSEKKE